MLHGSAWAGLAGQPFKNSKKYIVYKNSFIIYVKFNYFII